MREFRRAPVVCLNCKARIYWGLSSADVAHPDYVRAVGSEPPAVSENCPRCRSEVNTTVAYPAVAGFPAPFAFLKEAYKGFAPRWEFNRASLEAAVHEVVRGQGIADLERQLNEPHGLDWLRQRMFYRSCVSFYRCLQLFFAFLTLERHCFHTWGQVTGYYSRFYFIQAFLNLILSGWTELDKCFIFFDGVRIRCLQKNVLSPTLKDAGSHNVWWGLMEAIKHPDDYPVENITFILSRFVFNPQERNTVNYSFEYRFGGFPELNWFDTGTQQMMSHFNPWARPDRDVTDIGRYFAGFDPESCDPGDFYADDAQILWCSLLGYLQLLKALDFQQNFILSEKIAVLADVHLRENYPVVMEGILTSVSECLRDGFDVESFIREREANPRGWPWLSGR